MVRKEQQKKDLGEDSNGNKFVGKITRDFPRPDLGPNIGPFQFKNEHQLPKMVYIIPNYLVLHFGEVFMKIGTKIAVTYAWKFA